MEVTKHASGNHCQVLLVLFNCLPNAFWGPRSVLPPFNYRMDLLELALARHPEGRMTEMSGSPNYFRPLAPLAAAWHEAISVSSRHDWVFVTPPPPKATKEPMPWLLDLKLNIHTHVALRVK
jgi:hypothetical protein